MRFNSPLITKVDIDQQSFLNYSTRTRRHCTHQSKFWRVQRKSSEEFFCQIAHKFLSIDFHQTAVAMKGHNLLLQPQQISRLFLHEQTHASTYVSGQNKVPITYRLVATSQRLVRDFTAKLFIKVASIIAQPENFSTQILFYFRVRLRNN